MRRLFTVKRGHIEPCPRCGNSVNFVAVSERCAEDCCEKWVECSCGFDPTSEDTGERIECVWGSLDKEEIFGMVSLWNELVACSRGGEDGGAG